MWTISWCTGRSKLYARLVRTYNMLVTYFHYSIGKKRSSATRALGNIQGAISAKHVEGHTACNVCAIACFSVFDQPTNASIKTSVGASYPLHSARPLGCFIFQHRFVKKSHSQDPAWSALAKQGSRVCVLLRSKTKNLLGYDRGHNPIRVIHS